MYKKVRNTAMIDQTIQTAKKAGEILLGYYGNARAEFKDENFDVLSLVSQADRKSEEFILAELKKQFPAHGIYSEEIGWANEKREYTWYVDPLDGTSNFLRNIPLWGVSMGLLYKDEPILGVLHFPALGLTVYAEKGQGAFANGKKIHVSARVLKEALFYSGGRFKPAMQLNMDIANSVGLVKIVDASSFELAQIAMGDAELYELVNVPHDVVAGIVIVREAGGEVTAENGEPWMPFSKRVIISNGLIHSEALGIVGKRE